MTSEDLYIPDYNIHNAMNLLDAYRARLIGENKTPKTLKSYGLIASWMLRDLGSPENFTEDNVLRFRDTLAVGRDQNTMVQYCCGINSFLKYLKAGFKVPVPKWVEHDVSPPTREEITRMIESVDRANPELSLRDRAILSILAEGALRNGEVCKLNDADVVERGVRDPLTGANMAGLLIVRAPKGKHDRRVAVGLEALQAIEEYRAARRAPAKGHEGALFLTVVGKRIQDGVVSEAVRCAAARAYISRRMHAHLYRHARISQLGEEAANVWAIQRFAGHASVKQTQRYIHTNEAMMYAEVISKPMLLPERGPEEDLRLVLTRRLARGEIDSRAYTAALEALQEVVR